MRLLLDEMYGERLADALRARDVAATTVGEQRLTGAPDSEVFAAAVTNEHAVLSENVADFTRLAADHIIGGRHHHGLLVALSSRFTRRGAGVEALVSAILAVPQDDLGDRVIFLERQD